MRSQIMDNTEQRNAYYQRFVESQQVAQVDPWQERVSGVQKNEFNQITPVPVKRAENKVQPLLRTV